LNMKNDSNHKHNHLNYNDYIVASYLVHDDKGEFDKKAEKIAIGLTVGSWTDLPQAKKEAMKPYLGQVMGVEKLSSDVEGQQAAMIKIGYPTCNYSTDIPAVLITTFGKLSMDGKIKLIDLDLPASFVAKFKGPKFGIEGIRQITKVTDRPLLMSIFKSCIGQDLDSLKEQFYQQAIGGVDLIKDDEILFENPLSPLEKRVQVCTQAAEAAAEKTGQRVLYAVNITGNVLQLADNAKRAIEAGATALLFNVLAYGFDALQRLSEDPNISVPIMAHPAMAGALYPSQHYGIAGPLLLGKLMRLAGADIVLFPSPYGSVAMPRQDTLAISDELRSSDSGYGDLKQSFPVPSAGIHPGMVPLLYEDFGMESIINAGGGIHGHPQGAAAGGRAFRQAIEIVTREEAFSESYQHYPELNTAIQTWGLSRREG